VSPRSAITATFVLNGLLIGTWAARIPAVTDRLALSEGELALALAAVAAGAIAAMPVAGRLATRHGSREVARAALAALAVAAALLGLAPGLALLCAVAFAFGAANGSLDVAMNAHGLTVERSVGRPILSSMHAGWSFGGLAGAGLGALAAGAGLDVRAHLALTAALALALGLAWTRALLPAAADAEGRLAARAPAERAAGHTRAVAVLGFAAFACLLCEGVAADWSAVYVDRDLDASASVAALAYAAFSLTMAIGRLAGDAVTARVGPVALVRGGALLAGAGLGLALLAASVPAALAGFACLGLGLAAVLPVVFRAAGELPGVSAGTGIAAVTTTGYAGFLAGPPLVGALAELTRLPVALAVVPVLALALAALAGATVPRVPAAAPRGLALDGASRSTA
jgi:MFS family permease